MVSFGNVKVLWKHIGSNGPEQLHLEPSSTPACGNPCLGCAEAVPISQLCLWPCHLNVYGPIFSWMPSVVIYCILFPVSGPCMDFKPFITALHQVLPPVHSALAPDGNSWTVPGPGSSLSISGAVIEPSEVLQLYPLWSNTLTREGMASTGITLIDPAHHPIGNSFPRRSKETLLLTLELWDCCRKNSW